MKYILITGASGGIGIETASILQKEGYGLYLHYYKNKKELEDRFQGIANVYMIQGDLSNEDGVRDVLSQIHHDIDGVVYCAGVSEVGLVTDFTSEAFDNMVNIHLKSLYFVVNGCLPSMIRKRSGNIVVISSIWGQIGASCEVLYSMVKGGQISYVKGLAKEVALSGIRVNGLAPGAIRTNMLNGFTEEDVNSIEEEIPLARLGEANEVGEVVSFLLSEKSSYMTGTILQVNGGWHC